jgi:hypothetical protein
LRPKCFLFLPSELLGREGDRIEAVTKRTVVLVVANSVHGPPFFGRDLSLLASGASDGAALKTSVEFPNLITRHEELFP